MILRLSVLTLLLCAVSGCSSLLSGSNSLATRSGASGSLVDYLYPGGEVPPSTDGGLPQLSLPLTVGLAFVPSNHRGTLSATEQQQLLDGVANAFRDRPYVATIEVIPEHYLRSARGLEGMQRVAAIFGVDAMALVSYDQLTLSAERDSALLYWTVVGALLVKGNRNDVHTMVDTAVFDVASGRLLLRAPGVHKNGSNATLIDDDVERRALSVSGFSSAMDDMMVNLDVELDRFREAAKRGERATVAWRDGFGGGSAGVLFLVLLSGTLLARRARRAQRKMVTWNRTRSSETARRDLP